MSLSISQRATTAIIADDEPLLRHHLNRALSDGWPELDVVALAENGQVALDLIEKHEPDIAFLDIRMPEMDGIAVAKRLAQFSNAPTVVFITAYDEYAVQAFEANAVDYLLKPLDDKRLDRCIDKLKQKHEHDKPESSPDLQSLLSQIQQLTATEKVPSYLSWIKAVKGDDIHLVAVSDVLYLKAEDKYVTVMTNTSGKREEFLLRTSLRELLSQLDPDKFWQIHRSTVVNVASIEKVKKDFTGKMSVLIEGDKLPVSRAMQSQFTSLY